MSLFSCCGLFSWCRRKKNSKKQRTYDADTEEDWSYGSYQQKYSNIFPIGQGAFGTVYLGSRKRDNLLVITKFVRKEVISSWVTDLNINRRVPLEIGLLRKLTHRNIINVLDVCENGVEFQLVMEKHGAGMTLFSFIHPELDESLIGYIFRQVAAGVQHLHSKNIVHRDIKCANIVINEAFHVKLIDFGAATFFSFGLRFSEFYGTPQYISPEVLAGNSYTGPEQDIWAMGVTLYVLCFAELPFLYPEEILKAEPNPPYAVSEGLQQLLKWLLAKQPTNRCSIWKLMEHPSLNQPFDISKYVFNEEVQWRVHAGHPTARRLGSISRVPNPAPVTSLAEQPREAREEAGQPCAPEPEMIHISASPAQDSPPLLEPLLFEGTNEVLDTPPKDPETVPPVVGYTEEEWFSAKGDRLGMENMERVSAKASTSSAAAPTFDSFRQTTAYAEPAADSEVLELATTLKNAVASGRFGNHEQQETNALLDMVSHWPVLNPQFRAILYGRMRVLGVVARHGWSIAAQAPGQGDDEMSHRTC